MRLRLAKYWDRIRGSFWFLPGILSASAVALSFAAASLDETLAGQRLPGLSWVYTGGPDGARAVLETIAGSMITIAGVVFSLTLIALSLASSQFGPRLVRNYMEDKTNQIVLGTFVATFLYCLLVLRTIQSPEAHRSVPHLSVTLGVLFAVASLGVLIFFIHHVAVSIQADSIISSVCAELMDGIDRLFPEEIGGDEPRPAAPDPGIPEGFERDACAIAARRDGYVQYVDTEALMELAGESDAILSVERRPGHYVVDGDPLVRVWPADCSDARLARRIRAAFALGDYRTPAQDVEFAVNQLVEVALRALSPGVNDPFTAIACVDRLGSALRRLTQRRIPSPYRRDARGRVRVIAVPVTFSDVADAAFDQIRQSARSNVAVTMRLLETIAAVAASARRAEDRNALRRQADMTIRGAAAQPADEEDRRAVEGRYRTALRALEAAPSV